MKEIIGFASGFAFSLFATMVPLLIAAVFFTLFWRFLDVVSLPVMKFLDEHGYTNGFFVGGAIAGFSAIVIFGLMILMDVLEPAAVSQTPMKGEG